MASVGLETVAQLATALAAVGALIISARGEVRNQRRFDQQLDEARRVEERNQKRFEEQLREGQRIAAGNAKPVLGLSVEAYGDRKSLILHNYGPGTAVVTHLLGIRLDTGVSSKELAHLVETEGRPFDELSSFPDQYYLPGKSSEVLIRLTKDALVEKAHKHPDEADTILRALEAEIDEIVLEVSYEDTLGNTIAERKQLE